MLLSHDFISFASSTAGFCDECWGGLLHTALERGPACVNDKCPQPDCDALINGAHWHELLFEQDKQAFAKLKVQSGLLPCDLADGLSVKASCAQMRSFVNANSLLGRCPRGGCDHVAASLHPTSPPEIRCNCGVEFCILCSEEPHFPASCALRRKWLRYNLGHRKMPPRC